jgi:adenine phosphoribosyltransferase
MNLKKLVRSVPDFPKSGIVYRDITPVLADAAALRWVVDSFAQRYRGKVDAVVGIESRGFIVGTPVAYALGVGVALVRKPGKLPWDKHSISYELEYGQDTLEMHTDAVSRGSRVVVIDDLLATGGTAGATVALVEKLGAHVVECAFIIELAFLGGAAKLVPVPTHSLVSYAGEGEE